MSSISRILWRLFTFILFTIIIIALWQYTIGHWNFEQLSKFFIEVLKYLIPGLLLFWFLYRMYIQKIIMWFGRRKSAEINLDEIPTTAQVDGPKRSGKDSSQTGAAIIMAELMKKRYFKELKVLKQKLYLYDFKKINDHLNTNGAKFFVSGKARKKRVYEVMLRNNNCFLLPYWINKGIEPKTHLMNWKYQKNKKVPDVPFIDGLTPGGKHMLDLLQRYFLVYVRVHQVDNYLMTNQPVRENAAIDKIGNITLLFSKIFSMDFLKLKETTPIPFLMGTIILETETGMLYSNTDKKIEEAIKNKTGIRESHTVWGHLTEEEVYLRGITQKKTRPNLTLRELYESYIHVFRLQFKGTSNIYRLNYTIRRIVLSVRKFFIEVAAKLIRVNFIRKKFSTKVYKIRKRISVLHQKDLKKWSKGYIVADLGVYETIEDSGKRVKFPFFYGIRDSSGSNSAYSMKGFRQVCKITDTFGRYSTWIMNSVREAKEEIVNFHFNEVPNWTKQSSMELEQMRYLNYVPIEDMLKVKVEYLAEVEKKKKQNFNKIMQRAQQSVLPDFIKLEIPELLLIALDMGIKESSFDKASKTYKADIIKVVSDGYKSFVPKKQKKGDKTK